MGDANTVKLLQAGYDNLAWYEQNLETIKERFDNQFVAIAHRSIVVHTKSVDEMMRELKRRKINTAGVLIEHVSRVKSILHEAAH